MLTALLQWPQSSCATGQPRGSQQAPHPKGSPEKLQNVLPQHLALNRSGCNSLISQSPWESSCATFPAASWHFTHSSPSLIITTPDSFSNNFPKPRTHHRAAHSLDNSVQGHQLQLLLQGLFIESRTTPVKETKTKTQLGQRGVHHLPSREKLSRDFTTFTLFWT